MNTDPVIRLTVVPGGRHSIDAVVHLVLDDLHSCVRGLGMEIIRSGQVELDAQGAIWTLPLDPASAGTVTVATVGTTGPRSVTFMVKGIAALTLTASLRQVADRIRRRDRSAVVTLTRSEPPHHPSVRSRPGQITRVRSTDSAASR